MHPQSIQFKRQKFLIVVILTLAAAIAFGRIISVSAQNTPALSPCEQLESDIQTRAEEDAKSDRFNVVNTDKKKKNILEIKNLYQDRNPNNSCFQTDELWDIYEKKYDRHKSPVWMPFFVFLLLGGVIGAVISENLRDWFNQSLETIGRWIYQRFAGTPFFENIALKKYRQALIDKYQKLKIPFRPNLPLEMREVYVPLKVSGINNSSLIEAENAVRQYRRLMVKGSPGSGKSMLLKYLALSYSEGRLTNLSDRPVLILLELNRLTDPNLTIDKLEQYLVDACDRNDFPNAKRFVSLSLKQGRLMLLLDGLDEVSSGVRSRVVRCLKDLLNKYKKCRAIMTCRTAVYHNEFVDIVEQTLEIVEFTDRDIRRFLQAWKSQMPLDKSVAQLIKTLRDRPNIMALARNPLLLTIIAYLYTDTPFVLPHSRAEFYTKATDVLLELRDQERNIPNRYRGVNKRRVLQHLALYAQDSANRQQQALRDRPRPELLVQVQKVLPQLNLKPEEADALFDEIVDRSGLLFSVDGGKSYRFTHLTLQEYFVAAALIDKQDELIQRWNEAPSDWREIVKLWCGLANNSTALIEAVYQQDPLTGFECLADVQEVNRQLAQQIIDRFKTQLGQDEGAIGAFGSVAADFRPRGKELFEFLTEQLANGGSSAIEKAAAQALSMTNLPQAVEELARYYDPDRPHFKDIREALIRMGGLAVATLEIVAQRGFLEAVDDLGEIGLPEAAEALERLQDNPQLKGRAAYRLAGLLEQLEASQSEP